jgi:hypothetical protein
MKHVNDLMRAGRSWAEQEACVEKQEMHTVLADT